MKRFALTILVSILFFFALPTQAAPTANFVVNGSGDLDDISPGDGVCDVDGSQAGSQCTLRAAIEEANALAGADQIRFGNTNRVITLDDELPRITEQVTISGIAGNDATCPTSDDPGNFLVAVNGDNLTDDADGFFIQADNVIIEGLVIVGFNDTVSNRSNGIFIDDEADGTIIRCNHIGIGKNGTSTLANDTGIENLGTNTLIGGDTSADRNVISGNQFNAIALEDSSSAEIYNNYIGTDASGETAKGNGGGIVSDGGITATIGGAGKGNLIAYNDGAAYTTSGTMTVRYNSIFANDFTGSTSTGLTHAYASGRVTLVDTYEDEPLPFTVDLYTNETCPKDGGVGEQFLTTFFVNHINPNLERDLNIRLDNINFLTVAVTDASGDTTVLSDCITVTPAYDINDLGDDADANVGDGLCETADNKCTFRAAFQEVNAQGLVTPTVLLTEFIMPATLTPNSAYPPLTSPIELDLSEAVVSFANCPGTNQRSTLGLEIDGVRAGSNAVGLTLAPGSDGSSISGIAFVRFGGGGIRVASSDNFIYCSHVGLRRDGQTPGPYSGVGVTVAADADVDLESFVVLGSGSHGVSVAGSMYPNQMWVGVNSDYTTLTGNGGHGIYIRPDGYVNDFGVVVIGRNQNSGIYSEGYFYLDNAHIGTGFQNDIDIGNVEHGIVATDGGGPAIHVNGGAIANNGLDGVSVQGSRTSVKVDALTYNNGGLGIDLGDDGVTPNDIVPDADSGPNDLINFPIIESVNAAADEVTVSYAGLPSTLIYVNIYGNTSCDASGHGEGETLVGTGELTTDASGVATAVITDVQFTVNTYLAATARHLSVSEYSPCYEAIDIFTVDSTGDEPDSDPNDELCLTASGTCTLRAAIEQNNALDQARYVRFISAEMTIQPVTPLPIILKPIYIEGVTASSRAIDEPLTILDGTNLASGDVLTLGAGSDGSRVEGLAIINSPNNGLSVYSNDNTISGNRFGVDALFNQLRNVEHGLLIAGDNNDVLSNISHRNLGRGIAVTGDGNTVRGNSVDLNGGLGIDLGADGITANDAGESDGIQNFPVLSNVTQSSAAGTLVSSTETEFAIELFGVENCDSSGYGEGAIYLGSTTGTTDANGDLSFNITPDDSMCAPNVAATATNLTTGSTSELSLCVAVGSGVPTAVSVAQSTVTRSTLLWVIVVGALLLLLTTARLRNVVVLLVLVCCVMGVQGLAAQTVSLPAAAVTCGDTFQSDGTLTNGGMVEDESGALVSASADSLTTPVDIFIEATDTPTQPYDRFGTQVGDYYTIKSSSLVTTDVDAPLIIALPLPAGANGNNVLAAILHDDEGTLDGSGGWYPTMTDYDATYDVLLFGVHQMDIAGLAVTLVESADFSINTTASRTNIGFDVLCLVNCSTDQINAYTGALADAYANLVGYYNFPEPNLQQYTTLINGNGNTITSIVPQPTTNYRVILNGGSQCVQAGSNYAGIYWSSNRMLEVCDIQSPATPLNVRTVRHELFHAIQYAYDAIDQPSDWDEEWVMEATASLAEDSLSSVERTSDWQARDVTTTLLINNEYTEPHELLAYEAQDFWYHFLTENSHDFSILDSFFSNGIEKWDVNDTMTFNLDDAYWAWARDQAFEHGNEMDGLFPNNECENPDPARLTSERIQATLTGEIIDYEETVTLGPLQSAWLELTLSAANTPADVEVEVTDDVGIEATNYISYYSATDQDGSCFFNPEGKRTILDVEGGEKLYILVSNTSLFNTQETFTVSVKVQGD